MRFFGVFSLLLVLVLATLWLAAGLEQYAGGNEDGGYNDAVQAAEEAAEVLTR